MIKDYFTIPNPKVYLPEHAIWFWTQNNKIAAVSCLSKNYDLYSVSMFDQSTGKTIKNWYESSLPLAMKTVFKYHDNP